MEVATERSIAKINLLGNESGNMIVIVAIISMITGAIGYWVSVTSKVDKEIMGLGASQSASFLRTDFQHTIRKALQGRLPTSICPLQNTIKNFYDFNDLDFKIEKNYLDNPSTANVNELKSSSEIKCFFNPSRYEEVEFQKLNIAIRRMNAPNFISLSNFIAVDIVIAFKAGGKPTSQKFKLKYRLDVLTLNHYGMIFTDSSQQNLISLEPTSHVKVNSSVLFDLPQKINASIPLQSIMNLPEYQRLIFVKDVMTPAESFINSEEVSSYLAEKPLTHVFKKGIQYNTFVKDPNFKLPYEIPSYNPKWREFLDLTPVKDGYYPLPDLGGNARSAFFTLGMVSASFLIRSTSTNQTYNVMNKNLSFSCQEVTDLSRGVFNIYIFNHLQEDFTIDFTQNKDTDKPPLFCGLIAARNLTVILNNELDSSAFFQHHIIGKFILTGKLIIQGSGKLNIHDLSEYTDDQNEYSGVIIDSQNLRTQFFNQKYYSTQNFFLPVFKQGNINLSAIENRFYRPRKTGDFFNKSCNPYKCRDDDIPSPEEKDLIRRHHSNLMFEVYDSE